MGILGSSFNETVDRVVLHKNLLAAFAATRKDMEQGDLIQKRVMQFEGLAKRLKATIVEGEVKVAGEPSDSALMTALRAGCYWHESMDVDAVFLSSLVR